MSDATYQFSSAFAKRLCTDVVDLASKRCLRGYTTQERTIDIHLINIAPLQTALPQIKDTTVFSRAQRTIEHLRTLVAIETAQVPS